MNMNNAHRLIPVLLLIIGEAIYIWAEMGIAYTAKQPSNHNLTKLIVLTIVCVLSGIMITTGYYFGYKFSRNIWLVTAVSIGAILIAEPIISWLVFHELPTRGAAIGLLFGFLGIVSTYLL